ncbi:MAG: hypothetical protein BVN28_12740 [Nitrospira sp. ST-bin4]|jgi:hypothetical protein|nr:MAG: hypothetical protein BVN28_12740 [Nitrospira sp. ST-bin4]
MNVQSAIHSHIDITDTWARLYLFLAQSMDRCVSEAARIDYPDAELQAHLASTRATVLDMLAVNQVVKAKVERECNRVRSLTMACLAEGAANGAALDELKAERAVLKHKTMALSDLLAVFRAV